MSKLGNAEKFSLYILILLGTYQAVFHFAYNYILSGSIFSLGLASALKIQFNSSPFSQKLKLLIIPTLLFWLAFLVSSLNHTVTIIIPWLFVLTAAAYISISPSKADVLNTVGIICLMISNINTEPMLAIQSVLPLIVFVSVMSVIMRQMGMLSKALISAQTMDALTGSLNPLQFKKEVEKSTELHRRYATSVSNLTLIFDAQGSLLNTLGQRAYAIYIKELAQVCQSRLRNTDILCRYSDEFFIILLPSTDFKSADYLAKDLLKSCKAYEFSCAKEHTTLNTATSSVVSFKYQICELLNNENWESWLSRSIK